MSRLLSQPAVTKGLPMAMHNFTPPHLVTRPCRKCRRPTKALVNGQLQAHPHCPKCRAELDRQFRIASLQAARAV